MQGKTVLITGAKGGLGTHVTHAFLRNGAQVAGVSRSIKKADFPCDNFTAFPAELSNRKAAELLEEQVVSRLGKVDVLVHLMGGFAGGKNVAETDDELFEQMFDINLRSAFLLIRAFLPQMRQTGRGRIIAIGSRAAEGAAPGLGAYAASKTALVSLVRSVAAENKNLGITANVVVPATMDTPANRMNEPNADFSCWVQPKSVADVVVWLSSDSAADVSGAVIPVYGRGV